MTNQNYPASAMLESEGFSPVHRCIAASLSSRLGDASLPLRDVLGLYVYLKMLAGDARNAWPSQRHLVEQLGVSRQTLSQWLNLLSRWGLVKSYLVINERGMHAHYLILDHTLTCEWRSERGLPTAEQLTTAQLATRCYLCREGGTVRGVKVGGKVASAAAAGVEGQASIANNGGGKADPTMGGLSSSLAKGVVNQPYGGVVKQACGGVVKPVRQNIDTVDIDTGDIDEVNINTLLNNNDNDNDNLNTHESSGRRRGRAGEDEHSSLPNNPSTPRPPIAASNGRRDTVTNHDDNRDGEALPNHGGRRGRDDDEDNYSANPNSHNIPNPPAIASNGRRGRDDEDEHSANPNSNPATPHPPIAASDGRRGRDEGAGEHSVSPPDELTPEERARYKLAEGRLRCHYNIPAIRKPSPPTVKLLLELARDFSDREVSYIFDVVDAEKDRSGGVPPRQQYLRTTILNVKRERGEHELGGDDDERTTADRPRTYGAAIPSGRTSSHPQRTAEPEGLRELRERVWAMRAGSAGSNGNTSYSRPQRQSTW